MGQRNMDSVREWGKGLSKGKKKQLTEGLTGEENKKRDDNSNNKKRISIYSASAGGAPLHLLNAIDPCTIDFS